MAPGNCCVVRFRISGGEVGGQNAQQVVAPRSGAGLEHKPGGPQVVKAALEEPVMVLAFAREVPGDKGMSEGGSEHSKALACR